MDYNIESRLFLNDNDELLKFKDVFLKYLDNINSRIIAKEIKLVENKVAKLSEIYDFVSNITQIELLEDIEEEFPEEQEVYENEPIEFKNNLLKLDIFLVKKADNNFKLNVSLEIKDKALSKIILNDFFFMLSSNKIDINNEIMQGFNEDFKLYFRLNKIDLLSEKITLLYGEDIIWLKIKPLVFVKDFIKVRKEIISDFFK